MKKLYLIRYTYKNKLKEYEAEHYEDVYYFSKNVIEALTDIKSKFSTDFEINFTQFEEMPYKEA